MRKLYKEEQFNVYSKYLEKMANENRIVQNMDIYFEMENWVSEQSLSEKAIDQMDARIEKEDSGDRPKLKRIK